MTIFKFSIYLFVICSFVLAFLINISPYQAKRFKLILAYVFVMIVLFGVFSVFVLDSKDDDLGWMTFYWYFIAFGVIWPQLISRLLIQQRIESPVIYLKNTPSMIARSIVFGFLLCLALMILQPSKMNHSVGAPVYEELYVRSWISFLLALVPTGIFIFILLIQRTAFCANGLYYQGILFDWSNFQSYFWESDELYKDPEVRHFLDESARVELTLDFSFNRLFQMRKLHFFIPYRQKATINNLLIKSILHKSI
jgi:hypothetical protein